MPSFKYKAIDSQGKISTGILIAANLADVEQRLLRMGLDLISGRIFNEKRIMSGRRKVHLTELIRFCFHMDQLIKAGVPLLEGLVDLRDTIEHPRFREVIANLVDEVEGGATLAEAMAEHPTVFGPLIVNLIKAGEVTGEMGNVFGSLTETLKWQDELISTTKKLMIFPAMVGTVVFGVTFFLMIYLVPQLVGFITSMGGTLPLHTRALIATSDFIRNYWYIVLSAPVIIFFSVKFLAASNPGVRHVLDGWTLKIWLIGPIIKKIILSRFANSFAMMYKAGVPILQGLQVVEGIVGNLVIRKAIEQAGQEIGEGSGIAASFANTGLFPPLVVRMLKIGETTGVLDEALLNICYFYDRDVKAAIDKVQAMIEPVMTVFLGAILGWVMLSVLGPIYDTISKIKM